MKTNVQTALEEGAIILYQSVPVERVFLIRKGKKDWEQEYQPTVYDFRQLILIGKLVKIDTLETFGLLDETSPINTYKLKT
jgi:hypothetical protein